ncbi:hypothetical protein [Mesorhizobium sp. CA5]|uniref:hypothetical protein n=1 Tax=Mesorhizobium sp. CA5 TaxID=2876638 RepID=UPI001CD15D5A|nr:hypothetical protein [Mesorhizobium sp. CA5]MBZ9843366.1 hypothetical protein [Mesorhizobium sp. CA5]
MTKIDPVALARFRVLFALRRLSPAVQSDVLSDGVIAKQAHLPVSHPITVAGPVTLERSRLFEIFQKAADEQELSAEIEDVDGAKHSIHVEIKGDAATVTIAEKATRFPLAALLTSNADKRKAIGLTAIVRHTLTAKNRRAFKALIEKQEFGTDDLFAACLILAGSPEAFVADLHQQAKTGELSKADFLPQRDDYWENLTTAPIESMNRDDFIEGELKAERVDLIARDPRGALKVISLSFAAPELIPIELLTKIDNDTLLEATGQLINSGDPFAIAGAFDLCAARVATDQRFVDSGDAILDKLFADPARLCRTFIPYASAFVFATAHLAEHQVLQRQPVYWRRLAAAAHAALVTRTLGEDGEEEAPLLKWATQIAGRSYFLSVVNDAYAEPRWRPDWVEARHLAADIYGRLVAASRLASESLPESWKAKIAKAEAWVANERMTLAATYPAILQGALPISSEKPLPGTPVAELHEALIREPTVGNFLMLTPVVWAFGLQPEARAAVLEVVQSLRSETKRNDADMVERALRLAACIAAQTHDNALGELVSQTCVERIAALPNDETLLPTVTIILECAAANADRDQASKTLARHLESLAFVAAPIALDDLLHLLGILRVINEPLGNLLGRAIATARLGRALVA